MALRLSCPCGQKIILTGGPRELAGKVVACSACGRKLAVPRLPDDPPSDTSALSARAMGFILFGAGTLLLGVTLIVWQMFYREADRVEDTTPVRLAQGRPEEKKPATPTEAPPKESRGQPLPEAPPTKKLDESPKQNLPPVEVEPKKNVLPPVEVEPKKNVLPPVEVEPKKNLLPPVEVKPKPGVIPPLEVKGKPNVMEPLVLRWALREGDTFLQELTVTQKPVIRVLDTNHASLMQYRIVSRFTVKQATAQGYVVEQKVEEAKLLQADALTQPLLMGPIQKLPGTTFTLTLSPTMEVTRFEGVVAAPQMNMNLLGNGAMFQMASLLDRDGWKELAQSTFFQRDQPLVPKGRWSKAMTHQWGPMGSWAGQIHYAHTASQGAMHQIQFALQLGYQPPAGPVGMLPIANPRFNPPQAGGSLFFDAQKGRVVAAEERFVVTGSFSLSVLGQAIPVEIAEDQLFQIRILDAK